MAKFRLLYEARREEDGESGRIYDKDIFTVEANSLEEAIDYIRKELETEGFIQTIKHYPHPGKSNG